MPAHDAQYMVALRGGAARVGGRALHFVLLSHRMPLNCRVAGDSGCRRIPGWWCRVVARSHTEREHHLGLLFAAGRDMADAVGTQTETILVRALAYGKVSLGAQLLREGAVGLLIGGIVGLSAGACLLAWGGARSVAFTLAITLALTAMIATFVASLLPIYLSEQH